MKGAIVLALLLFPSVAMAQQAQPSPSEQALGAKLMREINEGLTCNATLATLQADVQKLQAKLKEAEEKPKASK